ncbi:hypothetical protein BO70DRAFT_370615 [Aspergillus heteromorphus CBS 117.55]|uniref:Uncharacterized protein n=1 Tax=Aspergillus heteromorphus CBS 117.55 TaxID=1448321 RepID=A0A317WAV9_9EURO|nr:uncharacterized protein BO70DRAFT_370615 [Aspergillus heteromorphus CBS 117.55]PWY83329.1 hypothetical protein BO70DRAFT_370615 [Aspergillus heteromorphus CBS 117.55]
MYIISTSIEIAAPPAVVRDKFLEFSAIPSYSPHGFIRAITPPGDKLQCSLGYGKMNFSPVVTTNEPACFSWTGSVPGVFVGEHRFGFEAGPDPARTRLVHEERFTGLLAFLMGEGLVARSADMRASTQQGFEDFNRLFRAWVEREV